MSIGICLSFGTNSPIAQKKKNLPKIIGSKGILISGGMTSPRLDITNLLPSAGKMPALHIPIND